MRRTILLAVVAALVSALGLSVAACDNDNGGGDEAGGDLLGDVMARGTLLVATDPAYPPQSSYDAATDTWQGFDVDVASEIAERMGVDVEFVTPEWDATTAGNWGNEWQLSVGSMGATEQRAQTLHFTTPYYYTPVVLAVHETNTTITGPADLTGGTVCVCAGCTVLSDYAEGTLALIGAPPFEFQIHDADVRTSDASVIQDLANGDCSALLSDLPPLQAAIDEGDPYRIIEEPLFVEPLVVAIDKQAPLDPSSLVAKVSAIIDEMHADGTLATLSCKWFRVDFSVADPSRAEAC